MSYVSGNPKTKKQLREWLKAGRKVEVFQPGMGTIPENGTVYLEGPHSPKPHRWYAAGEMKDGLLVSIRNT